MKRIYLILVSVVITLNLVSIRLPENDLFSSLLVVSNLSTLAFSITQVYEEK